MPVGQRRLNRYSLDYNTSRGLRDSSHALSRHSCPVQNTSQLIVVNPGSQVSFRAAARSRACLAHLNMCTTTVSLSVSSQKGKKQTAGRASN